MKKCLLLIVILGFFQISIATPFHLLTNFGRFGMVLDDVGAKCLIEAALDSDNTAGIVNSCSAIDGVMEMVTRKRVSNETISQMFKNPECRSEIVSLYVVSQLGNKCKNLVQLLELSMLKAQHAHLFK
jgi:hypothetical protein